MKPHRFNDEAKPHLFAHRGGNQAGSNLENTQKAFSGAIELDYKFLETDVIVTSDGKVICYHGSPNRAIKRVSGLEVRRKLQKLTYAQIQQKAVSTARKMPLLKDILRRFPDTYFSIDVKTKEVVEPLAKVVKDSAAQDRVIITSFSLFRTMKANQLLRGNTKNAALCISRLGVGVMTPFNYIFLPFLKSLGVNYLEVSYRRINKKLISIAHKQGMSVYAWTVNDEQNMRKMLDIGVDGIMSDEAELLQKIAKSKKA